MIRLTRSISVTTFDAEATVAVGRDRPEFLAVARLAADLGRPIGARDVLRELLGSRPEVLGWRVIDRCVALGLLDRSGDQGHAALSPAGRVALTHGEVLVPEEGVWRFLVADHPLLSSALLHAHRIETEPAQKERVAAKSARERGERLPPGERTPDLLRRCHRAAPVASIQDGHLLQLIELAEKGTSGQPAPLRLKFDWDEQPSIRLVGQLPTPADGKTPKAIDALLGVPPIVQRMTYEELWTSLVVQGAHVPRAELDRWRRLAGKPVLPTSFGSLPSSARHGFTLKVDIPAPAVPGLGAFDRTTLNDVPLVPSTPSDAQAWLGWLQWESIVDHVTPAMLDQKGRELLTCFPLHQPRALSATELLTTARAERSDRSWFLLGPSDLGLWS